MYYNSRFYQFITKTKRKGQKEEKERKKGEEGDPSTNSPIIAIIRPSSQTLHHPNRKEKKSQAIVKEEIK